VTSGKSFLPHLKGSGDSLGSNISKDSKKHSIVKKKIQIYSPSKDFLYPEEDITSPIPSSQGTESKSNFVLKTHAAQQRYQDGSQAPSERKPGANGVS
jgi:hypothetical protein